MANNKYVLTIDGTDYRFQAERDMGNYKLNLEKLSYDKGIYRPAEMKVTMNVSGQNVKNSDLVSAFHQKIVKLTVLPFQFAGVGGVTVHAAGTGPRERAVRRNAFRRSRQHVQNSGA